MTSDFDKLRRRDSALISATKESGKRTVRVFILEVYYTNVNGAIRLQPSLSLVSLEFPFRWQLAIGNYGTAPAFVRDMCSFVQRCVENVPRNRYPSGCDQS